MSNLQANPQRNNKGQILKGEKRAFKHGMSFTCLYRSWQSMIYRCFYKSHMAYHRYGGRGITVCQEWMEFIPFMEWSLANGFKEGLEIDRFPDNDGNYCPENCRWATGKQNSRNKSTNRMLVIFGETKCLAEWIEDPRCVVKKTTFRERLKRGWPLEEALVTPTIINGRWGY